MTIPDVERQAAEMLHAFFEASAALPERVEKAEAEAAQWQRMLRQAQDLAIERASRLVECEKDAARWCWARQQDWLLFSLDGPQAEQADAVVDAYMKEDALAAGKGEEKP